MKQQVSPAVMAVIVIVVVALVGFIGFKVFGGTPKATTGGAAYEEQMKKGPMQGSGGTGSAGHMPNNAAPR